MLKFIFLLLILCSVVTLSSTESFQRTSFSIKPGDEGVQAVKITTTDGETITCSYKYATRRRSSNDESNEKDSNSDIRRPSVQSILGRLSGICIRKTIDYWKYELCFEGEIKQVHAQTQHNLGRYAGLEGPLQLYDEGTPCESKSERKGRRSKVEFLCDRQLRIRSVEEVSTCSYVVLVGTPIVCGSSEFAVAPSDGDLDSSSTQMQDELWSIEVAQVGTSRVECSVRALTGEIRGRPERPQLTTLEFSRFDLEVTPASDSNAVLHHDLHVARAPDRLKLSIQERECNLVASPRERRVVVKSGEAFVGQLEFVQVIVRIEDSHSNAVNI